MSKDFRINPQYLYSDGNIDSYVKNVINYQLGGFRDKHRFFLNYKFGVGNEQYYVLYSGAIDNVGGSTPLVYFFDKSSQPVPDHGRRDDRKDVFDELMPVILKERDCQAKILFSYNITNAHWLTGEIILNKRNNDVFITIFTHNPYGGGQLSEDNFIVLKTALQKRIEDESESSLKVTAVNRPESPFTNARQSIMDNASCGVIAADEIVKRIKGIVLNISSPYPVGAEQLRLSQLKFLQEKLGEEDGSYQLFKKQTITLIQNNTIGSNPTTFKPCRAALVKQYNQQQASSQILHKKLTIETDSLADSSSEEVAQKVKEYSRKKDKWVKPPESFNFGIKSLKLYEDKIRALRKRVIEEQVLSEDSIEHLVKYTETGWGSKIIDGFGTLLKPVQCVANNICKATAWGELGITLPNMSKQALAYVIEDERQYELVVKVHKEIIEDHNDRIKLKNNKSLTSQFLALLNTVESPLQNTAAITLAHLKTINDDLHPVAVKKLEKLLALPCKVYQSYIDDGHYSTPLEISFLELRLRAMKAISSAARKKFKFTDELYRLVKVNLGKVEDNQEFFLPKASQGEQNKLGQKTHLSWSTILQKQLTKLQEAVKKRELLSIEDFDYLYKKLSSGWDKQKIEALSTLLMSVVINNQRHQQIHKKFIDLFTTNLDDKNEEIAELASLCLCHFNLEKLTEGTAKQIFLNKGLEILDGILFPIKHKRYTELREAKKIIEYRDLAIYSLSRFIENNPRITKEQGLFKMCEKVFEKIKVEAAYAFGNYIYNYASFLPIIETSLVKDLKDLQTCSNNKVVIAASYAILSIVKNIDNYPELKPLVSLANIEDKICSNEPGLTLEYCQIFADYAQKGCISNKAIENLFKVIGQKNTNDSDLIKAKGFAIQGIAYTIKNFTEHKNQDLIELQHSFIEDLFSFLKNETCRGQAIFALLQVSKLIGFHTIVEQKTLEKNKENINSIFKKNLHQYVNVLGSFLSDTSKNSESLEYIIGTLNNIAKAKLNLDSPITDLIVKIIVKKELKVSTNIKTETIKVLGNAASNPKNSSFSDTTLEGLVDALSEINEKDQDNIRATLKNYLSANESRKLPEPAILKLSRGLSSQAALNAARILELAAQSKKANFSDEVVRRLIETISDSNDIELKIKLAETIIAFTKYNKVSTAYLREIENFFYQENLREYALKIISNIIAIDKDCTNKLSERFFAELSGIFKHYQGGNINIKVTICKIFAKIPSKLTPKNLQVLILAVGTEPVVEVKYELVISLKSYIKYCMMMMKDGETPLANIESLQGIAKVFCSIFTSDNTITKPFSFGVEQEIARELINAIRILHTKYPDMLTKNTIIKCADLLQECFDKTIREDAKTILFKIETVPTLPEMVKATIAVEKATIAIEEKMVEYKFSLVGFTKDSIAKPITEIQELGIFTINYLEALSNKAKNGYFVREVLNGLQVATSKGKIVGINVIDDFDKIMDKNPKDIPKVAFHILSNISIKNGEILSTNVKKRIEQSLEAYKEDEVCLSLFVDLLSKNYIPNLSVIKTLLTLLNNSDFKIVKKSILGLYYIKHLILKEELNRENIKLLIKKLEDPNYQEVIKYIISIIEIIPRIEIEDAIRSHFERVIDIKNKEALFSSLDFKDNGGRQQILIDLKKYEGNVLKSTFTILERSLIYKDPVLRELALEILKQVATAKLEFSVPDIIVEEACSILSHGNTSTQKLALEFLLELVKFDQTTPNILTASRLERIGFLAESNSSKVVRKISVDILNQHRKSKVQQEILVLQKSYSWGLSSFFLDSKEKISDVLRELSFLENFKNRTYCGLVQQAINDSVVRLLSNKGSNDSFLKEQLKKNLGSLIQYNKYNQNEQKFLLSKINEKQAKYNLELNQINQLLFFLQSGYADSMVLLASEEQNKNIWFYTVIESWLINRLSKQLDIDDIRNNHQAVSSIAEFINKLSVKELVDIENILSNVSYQTVASIEELFNIIRQFKLPLNPILRLVKNQADYLEITKLYDFISKIILLEIPERFLADISKNGWDIQVILILKETIIQQAGENKIGKDVENKLLPILITLYNHGIDFSYKNRILEVIKQNNKDDWIKKLNDFIFREIFQNDTNELNANELAMTFAERLPKNFLKIVRDEEIFKKGKFVSQLAEKLGYFSPIQSWQEGVILAWAKFVRKDLRLSKSNDFLPEMLAVINRALILHNSVGDCGGYELRKAQILSILLLLSKEEEIGRLSQISTGEGKSVTISALAVINALRGEKVDIITSSPLLASRDSKQFKSFYAKFGLDCADNSDDYYSGVGPKLCYDKEIVYGNATSFQYDLLREEFSLLETRGGRRFECAIVDEVDSMLIDEGVNIAMLSSPISGMNYLNLIFMTIWSYLLEKQEFIWNKDDFISETKKEVLSQIDKKEIIVPKHLTNFIKHKIELWIKTAIEAKYTYQLGGEYRIVDEQITPVDFANTGVTFQNSRWGDGLHQFLEIKHQLKLQQESLVTNYCTNIAYFKHYNNEQTKTNKIFGVTGTLGSERAQALLANLYKVDFVKVPRYKQRQFKEFPAKICNSAYNWKNKVVDSVMLELSKDRAVLVICETEKDANNIETEISKVILDRFRIKKYTTSDSEQSSVIEGIMNCGDVIIATNLAGRGTDIKISDEVKHNGGLHVCVTFLPPNLRVEEQAFGRTAREGKPGTAEIITIGASAVEQLREERDANERAALDQYEKVDVPVNDIKQKLFEEFCELCKEKQKLKRNARSSEQSKEKKNLFKEKEWRVKLFYKLQALYEEWGLWLAQQEDFNVESYAKFKKFAININEKFENDTIIRNPIYWQGYANDLIELLESWRGIGDNLGLRSSLNNNITGALDKAIEMDEDFSFYAHYIKAYVNIKDSQTGVHLSTSAQKARKGKIKEALKNLEKSKELLQVKEISQLHKLIELYRKCSLSNKEKDPRLPLEKQGELSILYIHTAERLDILENFLINIDSNIKVINDSRKLIDITVEKGELNVQSDKKEDEVAKIKAENLQIPSFKEIEALPTTTTIFKSKVFLKQKPVDLSSKYNQGKKKIKKYLDDLPVSCKVSLHFHNLRQVKDMHIMDLRGDAKEVVSKAFENGSSDSVCVDIKFEKIFIGKAIKLLPQYRIDSVKAEKCSDRWPVVVQKMVNFSKGINEARKDWQNHIESLCHKLEGAEAMNINLALHDLPINKYEEIVAKVEGYLTEEEKGIFDKKVEDSIMVLFLERISQITAIKILNDLQTEKSLIQIKVHLSFANIKKHQAEQLIYLNADYIKDAIFSVKNLSKDNALRVLRESNICAETFTRPRLDVIEKYLLPATNREEILDLRNNEMRYFYSLCEKDPFRKATFCTVAALTVAQGLVAAGLMVSGVGIPLAQHMITETFADLLSLMSVTNGTFDWSSYIALKILSYAAFGTRKLLTANKSAITTASIAEEVSNVEEFAAKGLQCTDDGYNVAKNVCQKVVSKVAIATKEVVLKGSNKIITHVLDDIHERKMEEIKDEVEKDLSSFLERVQDLLKRIFIKDKLLPSNDIYEQLWKKLMQLSASNSNKFVVEAEKILQSIDRKYNFQAILEVKLSGGKNFLQEIELKEEIKKLTDFYSQLGCIDHYGNLNPNKERAKITTEKTKLDTTKVENAIKNIYNEYSIDYSKQRLKFGEDITWLLVSNKRKEFQSNISWASTAINGLTSCFIGLASSKIESIFPNQKDLIDQNPSFVTLFTKLLNPKSSEDFINTVIQFNSQYKVDKTVAPYIIKFAQGSLILPDEFGKALYQIGRIALKPNEQAINPDVPNHSYITNMQSKAVALLEDILYYSDDILQQLTDQNGNITANINVIAVTIASYLPMTIFNVSIFTYLIDQVQVLDKSFIQQLINSEKFWNSLSRLDKYLPQCGQILIKFELCKELVQEGGILDQGGLKTLSGILSQPAMIKKLRSLFLNCFSEKPDWYGITLLTIELGANSEPMRNYLEVKKHAIKSFLLANYSDSSLLTVG